MSEIKFREGDIVQFKNEETFIQGGAAITTGLGCKFDDAYVFQHIEGYRNSEGKELVRISHPLRKDIIVFPRRLMYHWSRKIEELL